MNGTARLTAALTLLACVALAPIANAQDADVDRMGRVIEQMEDVKARSTRQVSGAYARAWEPAERRGPKPEPAPQSWPMRHKWKLVGGAVLALLGYFFFRMERAWRRHHR